METEVKQLIRMSIMTTLATETGQPLYVFDIPSNKILTGIMALAYNDRNVNAAAQDVYEINNCDELNVLENAYLQINQKFPKQIEAFITFLSDPDNPNILQRVQDILG